MDNSFHHTLNDGCNYLSTLGIKLKHISKGATVVFYRIKGHIILHWRFISILYPEMIQMIEVFPCGRPRHGNTALSRSWSLYRVWHDDVIKWKHFPCYWPFVRGIHWSPVNSPHSGALMFSLICPWINGWVNNREAGDLRRYSAHYDVTVMITKQWLALCALLCSYVYREWHGDISMQAISSNSTDFAIPEYSIITSKTIHFHTPQRRL